MTVTVLAAFLVTSCGGGEENVLAKGDGIEITQEDFYAEFDRLLPEDQVSILEPGGKFDLVTRLVYREILLSRAQTEDIEDMDFWLDISRDSWLSRKWIETELESMYEAGLDTAWIDSMMAIDVDMSVVLMEDSSSASALLEQWSESGPGRPDSGMVLAPWTSQGSSYLSFDSDCFTLYCGNPVFTQKVLEYSGSGPVSFPLFAAWAVLEIDTTHSGEVGNYDLQTAAGYYLSANLSRLSGVTVISPAVMQLSDYMDVEGGRYVMAADEEFPRDLVLAQYPGGSLTAGDILQLSENVVDDSFFRGVPEDFKGYMLPEPLLEPAVDLWNYVESVAQVRSQAHMALQNGIQWPEEQRELSLTDHVLRTSVLMETGPVDTTEALEFYSENSEAYDIPEMRSIVVAYVPREWVPEGEVNGFEDLDTYYIHADSSGDPVPTRLMPREMFKGYGEQVFQARPGVFTGPVEYEDDDVYVYFQVVDVVEEDENDPMSILPFVIEDARTAMVAQRLENYLLELWNDCSIEIDSAAVRELDPWESTY